MRAMMTLEDTIALIVSAQHLWPTWNSAPTTEKAVKDMAATWHELLLDVSVEEAHAALVELASGGRERVPPVGLIRRWALDLRSAADGSMVPIPDRAWAEVHGAVRLRGLAAGPPAWSHPLVASTVGTIGWRTLCLSENVDELRSHFLRLYTDEAARQRRLTQTPARQRRVSSQT
jgi:hypothetical protein